MGEARGARRGVRVEILRSDPGKRTTFEVGRFDPMTVLDVLLDAAREVLRIEPMEGLPVARDLVVVLDQFVDPWAGEESPKE
jgi:hypothetical protein